MRLNSLTSQQLRHHLFMMSLMAVTQLSAYVLYMLLQRSGWTLAAQTGEPYPPGIIALFAGLMFVFARIGPAAAIPIMFSLTLFLFADIGILLVGVPIIGVQIAGYHAHWLTEVEKFYGMCLQMGIDLMRSRGSDLAAFSYFLCTGLIPFLPQPAEGSSFSS